MPQPEIAILVSTFERPRHLRRVLAAISAQQDVAGAVEVVITDDGSRDQTPQLVRDFADSASFPVHFTTHPHQGFHIARCRNEGVARTTAPHLLFLDGDCVIPPDHVKQHLDRRAAGWAMAGYPIYLDQQQSDQLSADDITRAAYLKHITWQQRLGMRWRHVRGLVGWLTGDPHRPKLLGGNLGIARADYERVNGYDENYRGWGCEDDDIRLRLRAAGIQVASIAWWTNTYHLWHPKTPTAPATWREGGNVAYFRRPVRLTRCLAGLKKRRLQDLHVSLVGSRPSKRSLDLLPLWCRVAAGSRRPDPSSHPEIQIAFAEAGGRFSPHADCRVLIVPAAEPPPRDLVAAADLVFTSAELRGVPQTRQFPLRDLENVLQRQLGHASALAAGRALAA
jgi:glycosyltransferase involved in cell wall biosynthesis